MRVSFFSGEPVLVLELQNEKILVLSDLHLGSPLIRDVPTLQNFLKDECGRIKNVILDVKPSKLVIAGDIKELIGFPSLKIVEFMKECFLGLAEMTNVEFVLGNHDAGLEKILGDVVRYHKRYMKIAWNNDNLIITHGHQKLALEELQGSSLLISGHIHPGYKLTVGGSAITLKAWFVCEISINGNRIHWIVLPAFSSLVEGIPLNTLSDEYLKSISPIKFEFELVSKKFYLLDLTPLV